MFACKWKSTGFAGIVILFVVGLIWYPTWAMGTASASIPHSGLPLSPQIGVDRDAAVEYRRFAQNSLRSGMVSEIDQPSCPVPTPETVSVDVDRPSINYSSKVTLNELQRAAAARNYSGPILGAYQVDIKYVANVDQTTREIISGRFCIDPEHVIVRVTITQTIHIPWEFSSDDCLSKLVREYQGHRAQAAGAALDTVQPVLLAAVDSAIHRQRQHGVSEDAAIEVFLKDIRDDIEAAIDRIEVERNRLVGNAHTPADKERLSRACGGRVRRL